MACAPPRRSSRVDARLERRRHHHRIGARTDRDDLAHAGDPRRDRRHQQRGGQRIASAGDVASDPLERRDALVDRHAGHRPGRPAARHLAFRHVADVARRHGDRPPHAGIDRRRSAQHLRARDLDVPFSPSNFFAYDSTARSPRRRTSVDDPRHPPLELPRSRRDRAVERAPPSPVRRRFDSDRASHHDLVERIFHDALRAGPLQAWDQIPDRPLLDDRVDRDPLGVAQRRDRRPLQRRQQRQDPVERRCAAR